MRPIIAALLIAGFAGSASAQGVAPNGAVFGQAWTMPQDFNSGERMQAAQGSGTTADRAARQARFNQHFPGTPICRTAAGR